MFAEQVYTKQRAKERLFEVALIGYEEGFVRDGDLLYPCRNPDDVLVMVAGGPEPDHAIYYGSFEDPWAVTKPVEMHDG